MRRVLMTALFAAATVCATVLPARAGGPIGDLVGDEICVDVMLLEAVIDDPDGTCVTFSPPSVDLPF